MGGAKRNFDATIDGDVEAAGDLIIAADGMLRGNLAYWLYLCRIPKPAYRVVLENAWEMNHGAVIAATPNNSMVRRMFTWAEFPIEGLPREGETIRIYRGVSGMPLSKAAMGISWSLNRDTACWFASSPYQAVPLVLAADIDRADVVYSSEGREESEIITSKPAKNAWVDGEEADWIAAYQRIQQARGFL